METPLILHSFTTAILHVDADGFFASVEQASNPTLKGKPVVVGKERGMATAVSYEAKRLGIERGMLIHQILKKHPEVIALESDYEKYSAFSVRMFEILRRFSPMVEEYSIDEAFVDLTGLRRVYRASYGDIGLKIKETIKKELGITVSIGISLTKVLAKIASKHKKPDGLTVIPGWDVHLYLKELPLEKVWGIGLNTAAYCKKLGINTALEFARKSEDFIKNKFTKPHYEIWCELNGKSVYPVTTEPKADYKSISKTKSFTPSNDKNAVFAQLVENIDNAFFKARRYGLATRKVIIFIKTKDYKENAVEITLNNYTSYPNEIFIYAKEAFNHIFDEQKLYRQTGVILLELIPQKYKQKTLFENSIKLEKMEKLYNTVDEIKRKFGKEAITPATSLNRIRIPEQHPRLKIPMLDICV